jgi:hypothetical protein
MPRRIPVHPANRDSGSVFFHSLHLTNAIAPSVPGFFGATDLSFAVAGPIGVLVPFAGVFDDLFRIGATLAEVYENKGL